MQPSLFDCLQQLILILIFFFFKILSILETFIGGTILLKTGIVIFGNLIK